MEEVIEGGEARVAVFEGLRRGEGRIDGGVREGDGVQGCEAEEQAGREGAFDVEVVFAFGEVVETLVEG